MKFCQHCGKELQIEASFCGNCGKAVGESEPVLPNLNLIQCPDCKKEVSRNASKCPHCGARIKQSTISSLMVPILLFMGFQIPSLLTFDKVKWELSLTLCAVSFLAPLVFIVLFKRRFKYFKILVTCFSIGLVATLISITYNKSNEKSFSQDINNRIDGFWTNNTTYIDGYNYGLSKSNDGVISLYKFEGSISWQEGYWFERLFERGMNRERNIPIRLPRYRVAYDIDKPYRSYWERLDWNDWNEPSYNDAYINVSEGVISTGLGLEAITKDVEKLKKTLKQLRLN